MYQLFKDSLFFPKRIIDHLNDKTSKKRLYFLLLIVLFCIPSITATIINLAPNEAFTDNLSNDLKNADEIHYQIIEGIMFSSIITDKGQIIPAKELSKSIKYPVYIAFDPFDTLQYNLATNSILIVFKANTLEMWYLFKGNKQMVPNDEKFQLNSGNVIASKLLARTSFESLDFKNFDFSSIKKMTDNELQKEVTSFLYKVIERYKGLFLLVLIPLAIISETIILFLSILLMTLIAYLLYKKIGLRFDKIFECCTLCITPMIIINFAHLFINLSVIDFVGELITVIYLMIVLNMIIRNTIFINKEKV